MNNVMPYQRQTALNTSPKRKVNSITVEDEPPSKCKYWLEKLEAALRWRQNKYDNDWKRAYNMYAGEHWRDVIETDPSSDQVRTRITVNVTMSTVLNIKAFLMAEFPKFVCKARKPESVQSAKLQSEALNYEYDQREIHNQVSKSVDDCLICGHGILKVGYALEIDKAEKKKDGVIQLESYIKEDAPYGKRICPFHFLIDPCSSENSIDTAEWVAEILFQSKRNVCANTRYNTGVRKKIEEGHYNPISKSTFFHDKENASIHNLGNKGSGTDEEELINDEEPIVLFELWSKRERKYYILAPGVHEPLLEKDWPFDYIDNFPYIKVDYIPIQDDLYGVGIPYTIEDQQFELNRVRTSAFEHRRRFNRKYLALENAVDPNEANKLVNGPDGTVVFVKQNGAIVPLEDATMTQDTLIVEGMIKEDIGQATGSDDLISGRSLPSRTTQGEVQTRTSLFRLKLDERAKSINKFVLNVGKQVLQHIKNNYRQERMFQLVGLKAINWVTLTSEQIKEEVDVSMESIAAEKTEPAVDRQQRAFVWQTSIQALPLVQAGLLQLDYNYLFAWMMESYPYEDIGKFFNFGLVVQPELQQQQAQQNNQVNPNNSLTPPESGDIMQQSGVNAIMGQLNGLTAQ